MKGTKLRGCAILLYRLFSILSNAREEHVPTHELSAGNREGLSVGTFRSVKCGDRYSCLLWLYNVALMWIILSVKLC